MSSRMPLYALESNTMRLSSGLGSIANWSTAATPARACTHTVNAAGHVEQFGSRRQSLGGYNHHGDLLELHASPASVFLALFKQQYSELRLGGFFFLQFVVFGNSFFLSGSRPATANGVALPKTFCTGRLIHKKVSPRSLLVGQRRSRTQEYGVYVSKTCRVNTWES